MESISQHHDDVALFIDWENFKISLAGGHRHPNVSALKEEVANYGRVVVAKAYADWVSRAPELRGASQFTLDPPALYAAGIEPVYVPTRLPIVGAPSDSNRTARVKNSVDVKMTADCIECAHSYANIGTYVLVSGDSDFIHVINTLRTMGKRVIIIGVSWSTSRRLSDQVDGLILYDVDVDPVTPAEPVPVGNGRNPGRLNSPGRQQLPEVIRAIEDLVRSERHAGRMPLLTSLKQRLMRHIPGFDERKLGFSGFKKMMLRVAEEGNLKLVTVGLVDWVMLSEEPDPPEAVAEAHHDTHDDARETPALADDRGDTTAAEEQHPGPVVAEVVDSPEAEAAVADTAPATDTLDTAADTAQTPEATEPDSEPGPGRPELPEASIEALAALELPDGPGDGQDHERVIDLIVMADTLEHQEGISHVAFNFLVGQIRQALDAGLEAGQEDISQHWSAMHSRAYVTNLMRALGNGGVFKRGQHIDKDAETGRTRRRSTFNLDREHEVVAQVLSALWPMGNGLESGSEFLPATEDPPEVNEANGVSPEMEPVSAS
jgi:uncharacterized LabA/DUF88 family protein